MTRIAPVPYGEEADGSDESEFVALTAEQVQVLRAKHPSISPWSVVAGQVGAGCLVTVVAWLLTDKPHIAWSVGYGALAVVLPAALFARGLTGPLSSANASSAALGFFVWEAVKVALTVVMLVAAPKVISELSWPAMLAGLVVAMKVYWVALAVRKKPVAPSKS